MAGVRRRGKAATDVRNRYDAGGTGRRIARWNPPASGPLKALQGFEKMRSRLHDAVRNDWAADSSQQKWVTNLIGTGIQPRFKRKEHRLIWDRFSKQADADSVLDAYGLQVLMGRGLFNGEVFLRRRPRSLASRLDIPVQVQVIESEFCPMFDADVWPGLPAGNKIQQGIERTRFGERAAYWFYREHPGDGAVSPGRDQLIRVAASQVAHIYEVKRPGQLRGVSTAASILTRLRAISDFEDATLDRQKLSNLFALFITRPMPAEDDFDVDPLTGLPTFYNTDGAAMAGLEPGIAQELRPGEDIKFSAPPGAGVGYAEYLRAGHMGTAAGQGLPYELMSGDIKDVSDRTLRVVINEFRRYCQQRQWITLIPQGCQKMLDWCMDAAALAGQLPLSELEEAKAPTWTPQGWEYIHPTQDAEGKKILLGMGVISKTGIITERGDEPETVFAQREEDMKQEEARGIKLAADGTLLADAPAPVAPAAPVAPKAPAKAEFDTGVMAVLKEVMNSRASSGEAVERTLGALVDVISAMQAQNAATATAISALAQHLAERPINVAAPIVNNLIPEGPAPVVNNTVNVPEGAAPVVTNAINVQPATVVVDVNLPERETTSIIDRDRDGNITNVKQTERTVQ